MQLKWKRPLYLFHRWAGIVLCAFFALWFVSGVFMMYVEFPQLDRDERLAGEPTLDFSSARLGPGEAVARMRAGDFDTVGTPLRNQARVVDDAQAEVVASSLSALMRVDTTTSQPGYRPLYRVQIAGAAQPRVVDARSGAVLPRVERDQAGAIAADFARRAWPETRATPRYLDTVQTNQWAVSSALNPHRPLHRFALDDAVGTELYVSSSTGEVVRDSTRWERVLNYPAAVTHWLYPTLIRRHPDAWAWMVDILAGAGTLLAVSGIWIGLLRIKRRPKPGKSRVPYRGLMRWHHIGGLAFGLATLTWVLSGLLSMNPGRFNPPRSPSPAQSQVYGGKSLTPSDFDLPDFGVDGVEAEAHHYLGQAFWRVTRRDGGQALIAGNGQARVRPDAGTMRERAAQLLPEAPLLQVETLTRYDDYYYTRHPERASHPLPVLRVRFGDEASSWFHLDPASGVVLDRSTRVNRVYRWLYNGLHSWDWWWLWQHRPLWDIAVIAFSLGGFALSMTGVIVGWRRLRHDGRPSAVDRLSAASAPRPRTRRRPSPSA